MKNIFIKTKKELIVHFGYDRIDICPWNDIVKHLANIKSLRELQYNYADKLPVGVTLKTKILKFMLDIVNYNLLYDKTAQNIEDISSYPLNKIDKFYDGNVNFNPLVRCSSYDDTEQWGKAEKMLVVKKYTYGIFLTHQYVEYSWVGPKSQDIEKGTNADKYEGK